ncbi:MAG: heavy-metal-associated domain-containing protein [Halobacteriales archaeon]
MTIEARVRGMTCQGCEEVVETAIELVDGVESVEADRYDNLVRVAGPVEPEAVADRIELAGYRVEDVGESDDDEAAEDEGADPAEPATGEDDAEE